MRDATPLRVRYLTAGLAFAAGLAAVPGIGWSQEDRMARPPQGEATIYRDADYSGPAVSVGQPQPDMGLAWPVNSIRVARGSWQLCSQRNYRGDCRVVDRDTPRLRRGSSGIPIQSMRPTGNGGGGGGGGNQPGLPGGNPSLRGKAAQFYPEPAVNGYRVPACDRNSASASCAANDARRFCQSMGWRQAGDHTVQTVFGRRYLADVLCK